MNRPHHRLPRRTTFPRVALIVETTRAYGRRIIEGVAQYVRENKPWLLHVEPRALFDPAPRWLTGWDGDGIIARVVDAKSARMLKQTGLPVLNIKASAETCLGPALVVNDQAAIGRLAAEHLMERGFRRFAFVGATGYTWSDRRMEGFLETIAQAGAPCETLSRSRSMLRRYRDGLVGEEIRRVATWLRELPKPLGVLAADDFLGLELLNACRSIQIAVPEEVAVVGVDNETTICEFSYPPLTSIMPDNVRLGWEAAALLDRLMRGQRPPKQPLKISPKGIVARQSTDIMAINDPTVAEAMSFIRENACRGIHVNDVLRRVGSSPATLQRRFQKWTGHSIYQAIVAVRISRVKQLLTDTELSLREIAPRAGFQYLEHLAAVFKQKTGTTLMKYRKGAGNRVLGYSPWRYGR